MKGIVDLIESERSQREEAEEAVLDVIHDMVKRVRAELEEEHREREQNFETLLSLLEDKQML